MSDLAIRDDDGVRVVAIDRTRRSNAMTIDTIQALGVALAESEETAAVRALVITGEGGRFSAGADLNDLTGTIDDLQFDEEMEQLTAAIKQSSMPVAAAIEGVCFGAAIDLAWACDLQVVATDARFGLPAVRIGLLYNPSSLARLHARLGAVVLRRILVLGEVILGEDLGRAGVAVAVVPGSCLDAALERLSDALTAGSALQVTKSLLRSLDLGGFDPAAWEQQRFELLAFPGREETLRAAKQKGDRTAD